MNTLALSRAAPAAAEIGSHLAYRRDIDGLRAIAVVAVLGFHAFPAWVPGGFVGVDVFFVISGFLITKVILTTLRAGTFSIADFYVRRVRRIFPALALVLLACLMFGWKTMLAENLTLLAKHLFGGATFSSNLLLWQEAGYFDAASEAKPLLHLWSLGIEEQFYIVWPLLIWWTWRRGWSVPAMIAVVASASFCLNVAGVAKYPTATFYSPLSRAWELLLGAGLVYLGPRAASHASPIQRGAASAVGTLMIFFAIFWLDSRRSFPGWWALFPSVGACLVIAAGPTAWVNRALLSKALMVGIGLISFPLYLWHWPLLILGRGSVPEGNWGRVELLLLSVMLAWATYAIVEKPFRFGGLVRGKALALSVLMLLIACASAAVFKGNGVPSRYPEIIQTATKHDFEGFHVGIRRNKCFMEPEQDASQYSAECVDQGTKPLVMIWGDSGAAALFPGFRALSDRTTSFRLAQFTSSACPPILSYENVGRPACKGNNKKALEMARELRPDVIVLTAIWQFYDSALVADTIDALKAIGIPRIIVVGPGLTWKEPPSHIVFKLWYADDLHRVPDARLDYKKYGQYETPAKDIDISKRGTLVEITLREIAEKRGAEYVSVLDVLCNGDGCLMRAADGKGISFFLDTAHLNPNGADFVVRSIAAQLKLGEPLQR